MLAKTIRWLNYQFRHKLRTIRADQLYAVYAKKEDARRKWEAYLHECRQWRWECNLMEKEYDAKRGHQRCTPTELSMMIRKLAGINPSHGGMYAPRQREESNTGHPGYRSVTPGSWANAVRAIEDDGL